MTIPASFDSAVVEAIQARLDGIVAQGIAIPHAIESGSRAWGFPSPDSDYDCRFIYVRARDAYVTPWPPRDVIETPLDAVLDVNGWDAGKLIKLLLKGNAIAIEWLQSPIHYRFDSGFRELLLAFIAGYVDRDAVRRHYWYLGQRQWLPHAGDAEIAAKRLFYALRPAMALRWLRLHPGERVAPMRFRALMAESDPPEALAVVAEALIEAKAKALELGSIPMPEPVRAFVNEEFDATQRALTDSEGPVTTPEMREAAEALFREIVARYAP